MHVRSQLIRREMKSSRADPVKFKQKETKHFVDNLPFQLTDAQRKVSWEILQDMEKESPMSRLLEGDVGSGKTVVAAIAMLNVGYNSQKQTALMVPTEVLAGQHFQSLCKLFKDTPLRIGLFTRSSKLTNETLEIKKTTKNKLLASIENRDIDIVVGTHALIQEDVKFNNLNLAIIDEQHRFGVEQRKALVEKSGNSQTMPHLLSMTATPIPRSLALALFSDLDISIIDELPAGRKPISTRIVPANKRKQAYDFIRGKLKEGRQAFVICPLIESSPKLEVKSVEEEYNKLAGDIFPEQNIGIMHGKLKPQEKEKVMRDFLDNKYHILVSTSVVEVGVDVPNATIMVIEGAERFGLSQLHQFRGRVGRGEHRSYCFLFTESNSEKTQKRLQALVDYQDGFTLSQMDLKLRGSGDMYGTAQKGFPQFQVASLFDYELMKKARDAAKLIIEKDPDLKKYPALAGKIEEEKQKIHWE
jgi:ATP-dependent DNA helicase RecG